MAVAADCQGGCDFPPPRVGTRNNARRSLSRMTKSRTSAATLPGPAFEIRRAQGPDDWRRIGTLRYRALRAREDVEESAAETYGDWHDRAFNCQAYLLTRLGRPAGTTRSSLSSAARRWPLPSMEVFEREIGEALAAGRTVLEAGLTAVDAAVAEPRLALFHLFKAHMLRCATEDVDWLLAPVAEAQIGFYRRMFNMRILSGPERCPGLAQPRVLMGLEFRAHAPLLRKRMPALAASTEEEAAFASSGAISFALEDA